MQVPRRQRASVSWCTFDGRGVQRTHDIGRRIVPEFLLTSRGCCWLMQTTTALERPSGHGRLRTAARLFVLPWYLAGWAVHAYLGLFASHVYQSLGSTAILSGYPELWTGLVMPHIALFALALAAFELSVAGLLLAPGKYFKTGVLLSIGFTLFLVQMGLGFPSQTAWQGFLINRLPNIVFAAIQLPLLFGPEARSAAVLFRGWMSRFRQAPPARSA